MTIGSSYASISIDRREAYYQRAASLIAKDPVGFYTRAENGRKIQGNIKPKDYETPKPVIKTTVLHWPKTKRA